MHKQPTERRCARCHALSFCLRDSAFTLHLRHSCEILQSFLHPRFLAIPEASADIFCFVAAIVALHCSFVKNILCVHKKHFFAKTGGDGAILVGDGHSAAPAVKVVGLEAALLLFSNQPQTINVLERYPGRSAAAGCPPRREQGDGRAVPFSITKEEV